VRTASSTGARPRRAAQTLEDAKKLAAEFRVPVVVEVILERVTDIAMSGSDIRSVVEFEELAATPEDAPTAISAAATD